MQARAHDIRDHGRRRAVAGMGLLAMTLAGPARAAFPERPLTLIVPFAPGGSSDNVARTIAPHLSRRLGQPLVIENVGGAGGVIGTQKAVRSAPDGYSLLLGSGSEILINKLINPATPYDGTRDLAPVAFVGTGPMVLLARPGLPARTVPELIALAKAKPGMLGYGSAGNGTPMNVAGELFKMRTGTDLVHVPYKGGGPAIIDLVAGQIQLLFSPPVEIAQQVAGGRVKVLATTAQQRLASYPQVPTLLEGGVKDYDVRSWFGVLAPAGTPADILARLAKAFAAAADSAPVRRRFDEQGVQIDVLPGEDFGRYIERNVALWRDIVKTSGAKID